METERRAKASDAGQKEALAVIRQEPHREIV
jgi:hypothetical protein